MKEKEIKDYITREVKKAVEWEMKELGSLKEKNIKELLYNYPKYNVRIKNLKIQIEEVEKYGVFKGGVNDINVQKSRTNPDELVKKENEIERLNKILLWHYMLVERIENTLEFIKSRPYYEIIEFKYFKKLTNREVMEKLFISESSLKRHNKRLIAEFESLFELR